MAARHWLDDVARGVAAGESRRSVLRKIGAGLVGVALGALAPEPAAAAPKGGCKDLDHKCAFDADCCSRFCDTRLLRCSCPSGKLKCRSACISTCTNDPCKTSICDESKGVCVAVPNPAKNGARCSSGNACLDGETCLNGVCQAGAAVTCDDNNPCTTNACVPTTGCVYTPANEGQPCGASGSNRICRSGSCVCPTGSSACTANGACCSGCCRNGTCSTGTGSGSNAACGIGGVACVDCTQADKVCSPSGQCVCPPNNACLTTGGTVNPLTCACDCPTGLTNCGGRCVNLDTNESNCGACGRRCSSTEQCSNGACTQVICPAGSTPNCACTDDLTGESRAVCCVDPPPGGCPSGTTYVRACQGNGPSTCQCISGCLSCLPQGAFCGTGGLPCCNSCSGFFCT